MKITKLYTGDDHRSHFMDLDIETPIEHPLGNYSSIRPAAGIQFREFTSGEKYDWHNAPQPQYIIYLEGDVVVQASGGETRAFKPGDVLFATDVTGAGHVTRTISNGKSIVVTTEHMP